MNDPNGPFYHPATGLYHLFFQYNPFGATWGHMSWGHVVSSDLVTWTHLPVALWPNNTYDADGVFSGSMTLVDGVPHATYTCVGPTGQLQCVAYPSDLTDPLLTNWTKAANNPVIDAQPPNTQNGDFRDPTTAWWDAANSVWVMAVGNQQPGATGTVQLYTTPDFVTWTYSNALFAVPNSGMFECPDFFPLQDSPGLHLLKVSNGPDSYWLGTYDATARTFTPVTGRFDYDYGQAYASKSFYDVKSCVDTAAARHHTRGTSSMRVSLLPSPTQTIGRFCGSGWQRRTRKAPHEAGHPPSHCLVSWPTMPAQV